MKIKKEDVVDICRYIFVGILVISVIQKAINPVHYENFSNFIILIINIIANENYTIPSILFVFILLIEGFIVIGLFQNRLFRISAITGIILIGLGIIASSVSLYFGLNSSCGCGLFGDIPALLLAQKVALLFLLVFIYKNERLLFTADAG